MIGLQVILFYVLFWWFSWWISGKFLSNKKGMLRYSIFGAIAGLPFYIFLFQWSVYTYKCSNTFYFVPEEKLSKPDILFYPSSISDGYYSKNEEGEKVLDFFREFQFKYIVSPKKDLDKVTTLQEIQGDMSNYNVFPYRFHVLEKNEKMKVIDLLEYGFVFRKEEKYSFLSSEYYIYDFVKKRYVSGYSNISYLKGINTIESYLLPFSFNKCYKVKKRRVSNSDLLKATFNQGNNYE